MKCPIAGCADDGSVEVTIRMVDKMVMDHRGLLIVEHRDEAMTVCRAHAESLREVDYRGYGIAAPGV